MLCFVVILILIFPILTTCSSNLVIDENTTFTKQYSRYIDADGWVYSMSYFYYNDGRFDESVPPLLFSVINLRYRYPSTGDINFSNKIQILGEGVSEITDNDMKAISDFLGYGQNNTYKSPKEILSQDRTKLNLNHVDEDVFFTLLDNVMVATPRENGKYITHPSYALLNEQSFADNYSFQIGFILGMGNIDVIVIDVLYLDSTSPCGYIQLSDIIASNEATEEQLLLYNFLKDLEKDIVDSNDFKSNISNDIIFEYVDITRLEVILSDIHDNNIMSYVPK